MASGAAWRTRAPPNASDQAIRSVSGAGSGRGSNGTGGASVNDGSGATRSRIAISRSSTERAMGP